MATQKHGETVTRSASADAKLKSDAQKYREEIRGSESAARGHFGKGEIKKGAMVIGGAYGGLIMAAIGGAGIYMLAQSEYVTKMEIFKKHWWLRAALIGLGGFLLWRQGYKQWGAAIVASAAAIAVQDWKEHSKATSTDAKGPDGEAGWWGDRRWEEPRWDWERRRREAALLEGDREARITARRIFEREAA